MLEFESVESLTFVMGMSHPHERLRRLRHSGHLVEINEKHVRWEHNKNWWLELNEDERRGWEGLKVTLAEIVEWDREGCMNPSFNLHVSLGHGT